MTNPHARTENQAAQIGEEAGKADISQQALDSAKSAHKRIDGLEAEVRDIRGLTAAMARVDEKVDGLESDVREIKTDVKGITARPGRRWDKLVAAIIGAAGAGTAAAVLALILK
jgi:t-SNARE complex subunit (syntaxin)